ncbi:MAG: aromatic ring-hydroxylating dioxygenase subunit alpha [Gammaproteobacteria bacterium]|nr:aromatic ring-hydroxylating dioxygenase subunit alpha [Gammaproteobacteria bacterium]
MGSSKIQQLEKTLPGSQYLDADHFRLERDAIFHREWFCVGRREGLDRKGHYRAVNVLGESLLLVCDEDGTLRGFNNVCRHRGAELVRADGEAEQCGSFKAGIRCPYHSWNYHLSGELHSTPHINIDKTDKGLHQVDVDTWGGYVFVRVIAGKQSLADMLGGIPARVIRYPLQQLRVGHRIDYTVAANWKVILENYNECYHCAGVHPELCKVVPAFRQGGGTGLDWDRGIEQREGTNTFTLTGTSNRAPFAELNDDERVRHKGELAYPNLMLSLSMDHVASFTLWPRTPGRTDIICEFLFHPEEMARSDFDASDAVEFWDLVNRQDWDICASVQRGMGSRVFEAGYYGPMEDLSLDIRNYVRSKLQRR